jgi:hypothetical protein
MNVLYVVRTMLRLIIEFYIVLEWVKLKPFVRMRDFVRLSNDQRRMFDIIPER